MRIVGAPPADLAAALAKLGRIPDEARAHPACRNTFKNSCIQSSLIGAESLRREGFTDARAVSTKVVLRTTDANGNDVNRRIVGSNTGLPRIQDGVWNGHMVVVCRGFLIDLSLGQFRTTTERYPEMLALPLLPSGQPAVAGLNQLARIRYRDAVLCYDIGWLHTPNNTAWISNQTEPERRLSASIRKFVLSRLA